MTIEPEETPEVPVPNLQRLLGHLHEGTLASDLARAYERSGGDESAIAALKEIIRERIVKAKDNDTH